MRHRKRDRTGKILVEMLEDKVCLSASVALTDGNLLVSGHADGPIEITVNEAQQLQVTDNGELLGSFDDVVDLQIELDSVQGDSPAERIGAELLNAPVDLGTVSQVGLAYDGFPIYADVSTNIN